MLFCCEAFSYLFVCSKARVISYVDRNIDHVLYVIYTSYYVVNGILLTVMMRVWKTAAVPQTSLSKWNPPKSFGLDTTKSSSAQTVCLSNTLEIYMPQFRPLCYGKLQVKSGI